MTCGFLPMPTSLLFSTESQAYSWDVSGPKIQQANITSTQPGIVSRAAPPVFFSYSTIPIIDSNSNLGPLVELSPPMNTSVSAIQVFRCALTLVGQVAVLDSQTQQILSVEPDLTKITSKWNPYTVNSEFQLQKILYPNTTDNAFIDMWEGWYEIMPFSDFRRDFSNPDTAEPTLNIGDVYLIQKLNMPAANHSNTQNITLHDFENALATLVASMFWTLGHIQPSYKSIVGTIDPFANGTITNSLNYVSSPIMLLPGTANITEIFAETQLELSIIAVSAGLVVSIILMAVALPLLRGSEFDEDLPVNGTGILHTIWLYRNHPGLRRILEQVEHPTDENLRAAGMASTGFCLPPPACLPPALRFSRSPLIDRITRLVFLFRVVLHRALEADPETLLFRYHCHDYANTSITPLLDPIQIPAEAWLGTASRVPSQRRNEGGRGCGRERTTARALEVAGDGDVPHRLNRCVFKLPLSFVTILATAPDRALISTLDPGPFIHAPRPRSPRHLNPFAPLDIGLPICKSTFSCHTPPPPFPFPFPRCSPFALAFPVSLSAPAPAPSPRCCLFLLKICISDHVPVPIANFLLENPYEKDWGRLSWRGLRSTVAFGSRPGPALRWDGFGWV
ncbi:hypothetical protein MSAN_02500600 [Mycena sanguinolenta]|uniref:Uncharacterized protein n=1 Tax=Mycena sanguinolenta TaxID=230812 RepID=A0A8H6U1N0_9AGAR|nr:hypothetical protein MSAN_02500600 [Mycena sanguinolenta]